MCVCVCRVLITATDIEACPSQLVFFNNFKEGSQLGKGMRHCIQNRMCMNVMNRSVCLESCQSN